MNLLQLNEILLLYIHIMQQNIIIAIFLKYYN